MLKHTYVKDIINKSSIESPKEALEDEEVNNATKPLKEFEDQYRLKYKYNKNSKSWKFRDFPTMFLLEGFLNSSNLIVEHEIVKL